MADKRIVIKYTKSALMESKESLFPCPVYISINGAIKFVDTIHFHKDKLLTLLNEKGTNGPIVVNYDEVMK